MPNMEKRFHLRAIASLFFLNIMIVVLLYLIWLEFSVVPFTVLSLT